MTINDFYSQANKSHSKDSTKKLYVNKKLRSDKGFRTFRWGDDISNMPNDFEVISDQSFGDPKCVTVKKLKNEKLTIGDIKITEIIYYFFNNQLGRINIKGDWKYYDDIKWSLSLKYGEPNTLTYVKSPILRSILGTDYVRGNSISWQDGDVYIALLEYLQETPSGLTYRDTFGLTYRYDPLIKQFNECEQITKQRRDEENTRKWNNYLKKEYKNEIDEL